MTVSHQGAPRGKFDFETASEIDLTEVGSWRYAQDPSTFILCLCYRLPGWVEPKRWLPVEPFPREIIDFVSAGGVVCAHNVAFEKAIWFWVLHKRMGVVMPTKWRCSLAVAAYRSLPMGLKELGRVLDVEQIKDDNGKDLLRKLSQPQRKTKKRPQGGFITPEEAPELHAKLHAYCAQDVRAEDAVDERIGDLPPPEYRTWVLDQIINQRGVRLDMKAVRGALDIVAEMERDLTADLQIITGGAVNEATEIAKIKEWCDSQGWFMEDMTAARVAKTIKNKDCPEHVRKVLRVRQQLGMASTKKLHKMLECVCSDGRVHDMLQYHGAGTGRWAGRTVQPQNFPRGDEELFKTFSMDQLIGIIRHGSRAGLQLFWDETKALKSCLRGMFIPEDDATFYNADFSAIEARMTSWMAGEQWKLDAFAAIDRGEGYKGSADIYCAAATPIFGYTVLDKKQHPVERQVGKVCLGANTKVLTRRGWVPIINVQLNDKLWDGIEWVAHSGLLYQGMKETIVLNGVTITPDHRVMVENGWAEAGRVASCASMRSQASAIGSESLLSAVLSEDQRGVFDTSWLFALAVVLRTACVYTAWFSDEVFAAMYALKSKLVSGERIIGPTPTSCLTMGIGAAFSIESPLVSIDATTRMIEDMRITAGVESMSICLGAKIVALFSRTWSRLLAGMTRASIWIDAKSIKDMSPATYDSAHDPTTPKTNVRSENSNAASTILKHVYDLADAGPRRRFTIATDDGAMVVHNCELAFGFQGSIGAWRGFDDREPGELGFISDAKVKEYCDAWREGHPRTKDLWYGLDDAAIEAVDSKGLRASYRTIDFECLTDAAGEWMTMILPNGRRLWYYKPFLAKEMMPWGKEKWIVNFWGKDSKKGGSWTVCRGYGGFWTENAVQAASRDCMVEAMFRVEDKGYPIVLTVHDEVMAERKDDTGGTIEEFNSLMSRIPEWCVGLPIAVDGWAEKRYRK